MMNKTPNSPATALVLLAFVVTIGMMILACVSFRGIVHHWQTVALPCAECVDSFVANTVTPSHIAYVVGAIFSMVVIVRAILFLKKQYQFHVPIQVKEQQDGMHLVKHAPLAAWSSGILNPKMYADIDFWNTLDSKEKDALIAHEQSHIDQRDVLKQLCLGWVRALLPLPGVQALLSASIERMQVHAELHADKNAIAKSSSCTLAQVLKKTLIVESVQAQLVVAPSIEGMMDLRIAQMKGERVGISKVHMFATLPAISVLCVGLTVASVSAVQLIEPIQSCIA